jgi:hypothetical protein
MSYVELHAHSAFSFLDGASGPDELALRAAELGYRELALTDHDGIWGSMEFAHCAKGLGLRPITGAELTLRVDGPRVDGPKTGLSDGFSARQRGAARRPAALLGRKLHSSLSFRPINIEGRGG